MSQESLRTAEDKIERRSPLYFTGRFLNPPEWCAQVTAAISQRSFVEGFTNSPNRQEQLRAELAKICRSPSLLSTGCYQNRK